MPRRDGLCKDRFMGRSVGTDRFAVNRFTMLAPVVWLLSMGALLVVPFLTLSDAEVALTWPSPLSAIWWVAVATATVQAALVLLVPRVQVWAMVLVPTAGLPLAAVASWETLSITAIATIATVLVTILNADLSRLGSALAGALLATALGYVIAGLSGVEMPPALIALSSLGQALVVVAVPAGAAAIVLTRREARRARESEQAALVRERDARAESAVARERTALARELHDIAAHHMSGIAVMASAIERQVDSAPEHAKDGAMAIRDQSRLVLDDLRRLVGLLREDDGAETAVYAISAIRSLIENGPSDAEVRVHSSADAELAKGIGPLSQLVGYRMVQEALANTVRHAPGAATAVDIDDRDHEALTLRVRNDPSPSMAATSGSGLGLIGMRERAELVGATVEYGPTLERGWEVRMRLPRDADHATRSQQQVGDAS